MLFGLVPTFFGLSLVLIYYLTARRHHTPEKTGEEFTGEDADKMEPQALDE
jgi:hypothetical protein